MLFSLKKEILGLHIVAKVEKQGLYLGAAFFGLHLGARALHLSARTLSVIKKVGKKISYLDKV